MPKRTLGTAAGGGQPPAADRRSQADPARAPVYSSGGAVGAAHASAPLGTDRAHAGDPSGSSAPTDAGAAGFRRSPANEATTVSGAPVPDGSWSGPDRHPASDVAAAFAVFDLWPGAAILLDAGARLRRCTAAARRMLEQSGCVEQGNDGEPVLVDAGHRETLIACVRHCIGQRVPVPCQLPSRAGRPGDAIVLHLHALDAKSDTARTGMPAVLAVLPLLKPARDADAAEATLRAALGLTHGEARVALALHAHADVTLAARALHTAPATARSHLKRIYQKLHLTRQGELIVLVERCLAGAGDTGVTAGGQPPPP